MRVTVSKENDIEISGNNDDREFIRRALVAYFRAVSECTTEKDKVSANVRDRLVRDMEKAQTAIKKLAPFVEPDKRDEQLESAFAEAYS